MLTAVESYNDAGNQTATNYRRAMEKMCNFLLPLVLLLVYTAVTSAIYYAVEKDCKNTFGCPAFYMVLEDATVVRAADLRDDSQGSPSTTTELNIIETESVVLTNIKSVIHRNYTTQPPWYNLTYWASFQFLVVSLTTIGYGDIYPCTNAGQALILIFSLLGIPITLITLSRLGKLMELLLHKMWASIYRSYRKRHGQDLTDRENRLLGNKYYVPLPIGLSITIAWVFLASFYFYVIIAPFYNNDPDKPFTFFTAFYFTIISFLTIGYGDYAPKKYNLGIATALFLLIGLSLVTICIDAVRTNFEMMFDEMVNMIDEEFADQLNDDEKQMSDNKKEAVKNLLQQKKTSNFRSKLMVSLVGKSTQKKLAAVYEAKAKLNSKEVHAVSEYRDFDSQVVLRVVVAMAATKVKRDFQCQVELDKTVRRHTVDNQVFVYDSTTGSNNITTHSNSINGLGRRHTVVDPVVFATEANNIRIDDNDLSEREHSESRLSDNVGGLSSNDSFETFNENSIMRNRNMKLFVSKLNRL